MQDSHLIRLSTTLPLVYIPNLPCMLVFSSFIPIHGTMRFSRLSIFLASVLQATQALAFHIELPTRSEAALPNLLARSPNATSGLDYNNTEEAYYINITLGGRQFSVLIDTGR